MGTRGDALGENVLTRIVTKMGVLSPAVAQSLDRLPILAGELQRYTV